MRFYFLFSVIFLIFFCLLYNNKLMVIWLLIGSVIYDQIVRYGFWRPNSFFEGGI